MERAGREGGQILITKSAKGEQRSADLSDLTSSSITNMFQTGDRLYYSTALKAYAEILPKHTTHSAGARSDRKNIVEEE